MADLSNDLYEELGAALRSTAMLQEPIGADMDVSTISPFRFFALTYEPRGDLMGVPDTTGLHEEWCDTVHKKGVRRFNRWFTHEEIDAYITGNKKRPQKKLFIRYDRALAARHVLKEIQLWEELEDGTRVFRLTLVSPGVIRARTSSAELAQIRSMRLKEKLAKRSLSKADYIGLEAGLKAIERFTDDALAREKQNRNRTYEPQTANPEAEPEEPWDPMDDLEEMLDEEPVWESSEESSTVSSEDDMEAEDASAEPEPETRDEEPEVDDLEDLLGGEIGFDPDPEDPQEVDDDVEA